MKELGLLIDRCSLCSLDHFNQAALELHGAVASNSRDSLKRQHARSASAAKLWRQTRPFRAAVARGRARRSSPLRPDRG